ncbi:MAG TPA: multiheme c-type cytochrome [Tahibacter sp.]|nr:multiheme c-type cytochrome [Tahibacter sp.]
MTIRTVQLAKVAFAAIGLVWLATALAVGGAEKVERTYVTAPNAPAFQTWAQADAKSAGCTSCHTASDRKTMHASEAVVLGCTDCHGGDPTVFGNANAQSPGNHAAMEKAHVLPQYPSRWPSSANPERSYTHLTAESPEFTRFINPGDLRIAREACGACHLPIIQQAEKSLMANAAMFWGAAAYNNGILPYKHSILGEAYTRDGEPSAVTNGVANDAAMDARGILPKISPMPAWETVPPADVFRVFERGGRNISNLFPEIAVPSETGSIQRLEEPGRPDLKQSNRGPGTGSRVSIPVLNIHKTRLNDPFTWFLGTNDNPGDFRSSGCSACHVIYANDRDPRHSAVWAKFGNMGQSQQADPTIPRDRPGHPIKHEFTRQIPTSQCMICHMHQPNMFINSMLGYTMWDYESDAPFMWPEKQHYPDDAEMRKTLDRNPEEAAIRGKWRDVDFLKDVSLMNPQLKDTQFADYHGHGWNFRAIFSRDRKGNLLDAKQQKIDDDDPEKWKKAVHMSSIHVDVGMQCVDCHFEQDAHGNGYLKAEVMGAVEIQCQDCHGTVDALPTLKTSGPAASKTGKDLLLIRNPDGKKRFEWVGDTLVQRSAVTPGLEWTMSLTKDVSDPASPRYNEKATRAHAMSRDTATQKFGADVPLAERAHGEDKMLCYTCHTSWTTSCGGCHLPIQANWKTERHKYEGGFTRNFATYNPQVARDDMFFLGVHGGIKDHKIAPVRSSSALVLSSTNINRERIYIQQPPIAASGYSSQAFAPHYPHTERKTETKTCTDCHLAAANDNNAILAQTLLLGTRFVDFVGFNAWVGGDGEIAAVRVTEWDEPQAVVGSYLQRYAYPDWYKAHQDRGLELPDASEHAAGKAQCIQLRGEYLFVAEGERGMRVYDVASAGNKGFSQKLVTAPFSPLGQDTRIESANATCVVLPTTQPVAPSRSVSELMQGANAEQPMHPLYKYAFITDATEGLIATDVETLSDQEPRNNFLKRAMTWNDGGALNGARHLAIAGTTFYVVADAGVVVLDLDDPTKPRKLATIPIANARAAAVQFRYLFVTAADGLHVVDITQPAQPREIDGARLALRDARKLHLARTYAYVANGAEGLAIVDITRPENPVLYQSYNADGKLTDATDVVVATTNASLFAYVADGRNGLKVIQLTSPESQPKFYGFSPEPKPRLIAWRKTDKPALSLSRGLERDRAVDETGHQIAVFGRIGSRPFTLEEMKKLYLKPDGSTWTVEDVPTASPR